MGVRSPTVWVLGIELRPLGLAAIPPAHDFFAVALVCVLQSPCAAEDDRNRIFLASTSQELGLQVCSGFVCRWGEIQYAELHLYPAFSPGQPQTHSNHSASAFRVLGLQRGTTTPCLVVVLNALRIRVVLSMRT